MIKENFFATGAWLNGRKNITHLLLHEVCENGEWETGKVKPVQEILQLIDKGEKIRTLRWSYVSAKWVKGVLIKAATKEDGSRYIKAISDNVVTHNLEHLLVMNGIF